MKLKEISPKSLKKVLDTELSTLHLRCHQLYGKTKEFSEDDIVKIHVWILNEMRYRGVGYLLRDNPLDRKTRPLLRKEERTLSDYEYLLHHVEVGNAGVERIHHCFIYDHLGNMFSQAHLLVKNGKVYVDEKEVKEGLFHFIVGLETSQEVAWSNEEAEKNNIKPKNMKAGMTLKEKAKEW